MLLFNLSAWLDRIQLSNICKDTFSNLCKFLFKYLAEPHGAVLYELVEEVLCHLEDGGVVVLHAAAGEDESGRRVGQVVCERNVDVERGA